MSSSAKDSVQEGGKAFRAETLSGSVGGGGVGGEGRTLLFGGKTASTASDVWVTSPLQNLPWFALISASLVGCILPVVWCIPSERLSTTPRGSVVFSPWIGGEYLGRRREHVFR